MVAEPPPPTKATCPASETPPIHPGAGRTAGWTSVPPCRPGVAQSPESNHLRDERIIDTSLSVSSLPARGDAGLLATRVRTTAARRPLEFYNRLQPLAGPYRPK